MNVLAGDLIVQRYFLRVDNNGSMTLFIAGIAILSLGTYLMRRRGASDR
ncbi:LPXTG cell wall anchor domain-containing protein, partial [Klebsiella pneumoniae]